VRPTGNAYAVVIGIESYQAKPTGGVFSAHDAKIMAEYLKTMIGVPSENVILLTNEYATKSDLEKYFERWLANNVESDSRVFIYYSGHGAPDPRTGDAYLVPYDGDPSFIEKYRIFTQKAL